ncbi:MAG: PTS ascorbate transporter subunit IIC [Pirellulales bacterium]|nr:PTS ascorbate transporter subunit IIC [Pirellulales bacterium]
MKPRKAFPLRIDPALYDALERWAAAELRSVNGQIEYLLAEAVRRRGRLRDADKREEAADSPNADVGE